MRKVLWIGDFVTPTGFARVNHGITQFLSPDKYQIDILGINYTGDPNPWQKLDHFRIFPAKLATNNLADVYGWYRLPHFQHENYDFIFILNDVWMVNNYLKVLKDSWNRIPPIITYFPVDGGNFDKEWFEDFDIVNKTVVYTKFGYNVVKECVPHIEPLIMPHGIDTSIFYETEGTYQEKRLKYFERDDYNDAFIVLNANRNQERKKVNIAMKGFSLFAKGKTGREVRYYHHAGIKDAGVDVMKLALTYGIDDHFTLTNLSTGLQTVSDEELNTIYNIADVGINTSLGEGWGLTNIEHAVTRAAQIVPDHSACRELFSDCGILVPTFLDLEYPSTLTLGSYTTPEAVAEALEKLYSNPELKQKLADKAYDKFTSDEYNWKTISDRWDKLFDTL